MKAKLKDLKENICDVLFINIYMKDGTIHAFCNPVDVLDENIILSETEYDFDDNPEVTYDEVPIGEIKDIEIVRKCA